VEGGEGGGDGAFEGVESGGEARHERPANRECERGCGRACEWAKAGLEGPLAELDPTPPLKGVLLGGVLLVGSQGWGPVGGVRSHQRLGPLPLSGNRLFRQ